MFGIVRTILAIMVMVYHLLMANIQLGIYAVFGFYVISGFLMTAVMHDAYGFSFQGRINFALSRFMRLYPSYWIVALLCVFTISLIGSETSTNFHSAMFVPHDIASTLQNLTMIFAAWRPISESPNVVPPVWAITVELFFYTCICLGLSKTRLRTIVWFVVSIAYVVYSFYIDLPWQDRYYPIMAASLPFSVGAGLYFLCSDERILAFVQRLNGYSAACFALLLFNCIFWIYLSRSDLGALSELGFYINLALCGLLTLGIGCNNPVHPLGKSLDQRVGRYSYPIYLLHMPIGLILYATFDVKHTYFSSTGMLHLLLALALVLVASFLLLKFVDTPVEKYRASLRRSRD